MNGNVVNMPGTTGNTATQQNVVEKSNLNQIRSSVGAYFIGNFGGKDRYIRFDLNAFAEMEEKFGDMEAAQERLKGGSMKDIRTVLWLGLIWDEVILDEVTGEPIKYTLSEYQVGSWLTTLNLEEVMGKLQDAISGSLPDNPEEKTSGEIMTATAQSVQGTDTQAGEIPN